jgi:Tol biopolymer transport system component/C-terminal processing protease CtpA/Prc
MKETRIGRLFSIAVIILLSFGILYAQEALWMRYPAISPDGQHIVFSYQGNLYKVNSDGGKAIPLTMHPAYDFYPVWSNDGQHIAFTSNRYGNFDVFLIPKDGGTPKRLTFHSSDDVAYAFTPDSMSVLFGSARLDHPRNMQFPTGSLPELYSVKVDGGRPVQILTTPALHVNLNSDGSRMLFEDTKGFEDPFRKHHTSSITRDIWLYEKDGNVFRRLSSFVGEDRDPVFTPNGDDFYYLSEKNGTMNVFKSSVTNPDQSIQISNFDFHPVRYLSSSRDGLICYSHHGEIYTQRENNARNKVSIQVLSDHLSNPTSVEIVSKEVREMALSPSGKELAFVFRGEVFVTSVDGALTKRVTNTPEQERFINYSPDGKSLVYASERNNSWNIYMTSLKKNDEKYFMNSTVLEEKPLLETAEETFQPAFSPDGKEIAFIEERTRLKVINLESKEIRTIMDGSQNFSYLDGDQHYDWSPDGKWFLLHYQLPEYWFNEVGLISSDGKGKVFNLTKSGFYDASPQWVQNGKMMIWGSNKSGMHSVAKSGPTELDIYGLFFTKKAFDIYRMSKEEYELYKEAEDEVKKEEEKKDEKKEKEKKKEEKEKIEPVMIDWDGLTERKTRLTIHSSRLSDAEVTHDGKYLLYFSQGEKGYDLWRTELRTKETKVLAKFGGRGGALELDKKGSNVFVLSGGAITKVEVESGKKKPVAIQGEMVLNENAERDYLYDHVTRQVTKKFYDPGLHGAQWDMLTTEYRRFLPHINNNFDFQEMLSELLGELNASHTGARYRFRDPKGDQTACFGVFFDQTYEGVGLKVVEIMEGSPIVQSGSKISEGVIIERIDGVTIEPGLNYYPLLNRKTGKITLLSLFNPQNSERWEEKVKPISFGQERQLLYNRWVKRNRKVTHELSEGRLGYMHIRGMSDSSYRVFIDAVMGEEVNREALIVDSRFNGGGDLVDDLTTFLSGERYQVFKAPDRNIGFESQRRWTKPSIVLVCESNYSDAHCFPAAYRDQGIGKIVGMPVPGTCTFVWWEMLQNNVVFGIPNLGVADKSGDILENKQLEPDILVRNEYDKVASGVDQQLDRAVKELLEELGKK